MARKAIIVGSGIGGLATAILLSKKGFNVEIFEKNSFVGGRCSGFIKDGHRFDAGATMLMMTPAFDDFYRSIGKSLHQELDLIRMNPAYRVYFSSGTQVDMSPDLAKLKPQFEAIEKGSYYRFLKYLRKSSVAFKRAMKHFIERNFYSIFDMFSLKVLALLPKIKAYTSYYGAVKEFFKSPELHSLFTLQSLYLGLNPAKTPGVFFALPEMELSEGVWFPKGGMGQISENLLSIARDNNVKIHLNSPVKQINTGKNSVEGITLEDGTLHKADIIIANADLPYVYNNLLPKSSYIKKLDKMEYTCSALVFHWGMDKVFPQLEQHNVFFSQQHKTYLDAVFEDADFPVDPTFYLHSPAQNDITAAPESHDSISVIIPIANLDKKKENWEELKDKCRKGILARLANEGIPDIEKHIKFETIFMPHEWKAMFNFTKGATFGSLSHKLMQMGYFRPHNQHKKYKNMFFVGASTHPGNGVPMTLISAKLVTERIINSLNK